MLSENKNLPHLNALGLKYNPFPVVPDSHNYFTTEEMFSEISDILHCIDARKGFVLISGEVGLGKTTLSRLLLQKLEEKNINTSLVLNTFLQSGSLLRAINNDFNIHIESEEISDQLDALNTYLIEQYGNDRNCVIVIDDAQQLNLESLELVRQLSNLETNQNKLVQIILVAQSEILDTLNRHDMRQLKSRIALNLKINPLTIKELEQYIDFRLVRAGSNGRITLEKNALHLLHKLTNGYPRQVNLVMDRCLYVVAAYGNNKINKNLIATAHKEISIKPSKISRFKFNLNWQSVAAVFVLMAGVLAYKFQDKIFSTFNKFEFKSETMASNEIDDLSFKNLANVKEVIVIPKTNQETLSKEQNIAPDERVFLRQFGANELAKNFIEALEINDFTLFEDQLYNRFGYKILISDDEILSKKTDEIWNFKVDNQSKWLTFWKPNIQLNAFYQGYFSEQVLQLQSNLQSEGFYRSIVDGVVGEKTILAISNFQKTVGLKASGFPDDITLYHLQKLNKSSMNISTEIKKTNNEMKSKSSFNKVKTDSTYSLANNSLITELEQ